ncbi:sulfite exporter TauE/SafE family protein [Microvirga pudoricolor]|uniref:sulfite exporter TauE/SafE family protein n=1 Tax=Microvirga pudoricolor TaxID=2778729 RepID=UPI00194F8AF6|nr:sulfite exporter TauE/SafE family protein [Microvirga pudoricolor]MBM6594711.1 sulfite exporter TauE/SafE family protein [Microvirga pudoricolor]
MDLSTAALLAASGLAAGLVNAIAGGGTFFTFSALVAAGLPPVVANATSAVAVTPANLSSAWAYRRELLANLRRFTALGLVSLSGGLIGAYILTVTDNASFRQLVPWLLLFATGLFAASPRIVGLARSVARHEGHAPSRQAWAAGLTFQFLVSIYGGFFGAGMGIVMLAALAITEGDDFHLINSAKHLCSTLIQLIAVVVFIQAGLVSWRETFIVGAASVVGGYLGVVYGRRLPAPVIRWLVIAIGAALTVWFFVR